jgi:hypothetical protein
MYGCPGRCTVTQVLSVLIHGLPMQPLTELGQAHRPSSVSGCIGTGMGTGGAKTKFPTVLHLACHITWKACREYLCFGLWNFSQLPYLLSYCWMTPASVLMSPHCLSEPDHVWGVRGPVLRVHAGVVAWGGTVAGVQQALGSLMQLWGGECDSRQSPQVLQCPTSVYRREV